MKKKVICLILSFVMFFTMFLNLESNAEATKETSTWSVSTAITTIEGNGSAESAVTTAQQVTGALLTIFQVAGTGIALVILAYIGIKYMTASPEGKAELKKTATGYIVGAVILFAASNLVKIIATFATTNI